jgi:hypothetical protein
MNVHNKFLAIRIGKRECLFFIYTKKHMYGVTWDDQYGWDWNRADK